VSERESAVTASEFRELTLSLLSKYEKDYKGSLEEYLRSLLVTISKYRSKSPSYSLFALMLEEAFQVNPSTFDNNWLQYTEPLPNRLQQVVWEAKSKASGLRLPITERTARGLSDFE